MPRESYDKSGQPLTSKPAGGSNVITVRRKGVIERGVASASRATMPAQAPAALTTHGQRTSPRLVCTPDKIGRASCRERVQRQAADGLGRNETRTSNQKHAG